MKINLEISSLTFHFPFRVCLCVCVFVFNKYTMI